MHVYILDLRFCILETVAKASFSAIRFGTQWIKALVPNRFYILMKESFSIPLAFMCLCADINSRPLKRLIRVHFGNMEAEM